MAFPSAEIVVERGQLPLLSASLVFLGLLVFLLVPTPASRGAHNPEEALESAFVFWQGHGYLEPDAQVLAFADRHFDDRSRAVKLAALGELGRRAMPTRASQRKTEQARLDVMSLAATSESTRLNPLRENHPFRAYGFTPSSPKALNSITHVFLHAGWLHFVSVAVLFFLLAASTEEHWGRSALGFFLLCATLISAGAHWLLEPESPMSWIGASGPVAALFAVFVLRHRNQPVRWVAAAYRSKALTLRAYRVPAFVVPALWVVATLAQTVWLEEIGVRNDLSVSAIAGGLAWGVFASVLMHAFGFESQTAAPQIETRVEARTASPGVDEASVTADSVTNRIRELVRKNDLVRAAALWTEHSRELPSHHLPASELVSLVPALLANHDVEFACAALRQAVNSNANEVGVGLALEILDLAREIDPFTALLAARRALEFDELHESKRSRIVALIRQLDPESANELELETEPEPIVDAETAPLPPSSGIEYADPEVTQVPFLHAPPPDIVLVPGAVNEAPHETDAIDLAALPRFDAIKVVAAVPTELTDDSLYFRLGNGRRAKVSYAQVQACAVAALRDIASKPVVVVDLLLNWNELSDAPLRSIRLRSDQFDPARLIVTSGTPTENLQAFLAEVLRRTGALPLPDEAAAHGHPFRAFKFLRGYQRRILKVDC